MKIKDLMRGLDNYPGDEPLYVRDLATGDSLPLAATALVGEHSVFLYAGMEPATVAWLKRRMDNKDMDEKFVYAMDYTGDVFPVVYLAPYDEDEEPGTFNYCLALEYETEGD